MKGCSVAVPQNYLGVILNEKIPPMREKQERKFYVQNSFNSFIYWNWSKAPSRNDAIVQALDWIDIAEAVSCLYKV